MISRKLFGAAALSLFATVASAAYPERDITGTIMWGAGGAMDVVSRAIQPHAEAALGKKIVMVNKPGGTGAISTNFIVNAPADGYNILFGAENPQLHKVLGLAEFDYDKFFPVAFSRAASESLSSRPMRRGKRLPSWSKTRKSVRARSSWP